MSALTTGQADPRRDNRHRFIYLAQAIDLAEDDGTLVEGLDYVAARASEYLQMPVFDPRRAWSRSNLLPHPTGHAGRDALVGANQVMALSASLLIAVFDIRTPSWGMPFEVLARAEQPNRPILLVSPQDPSYWPQYLQWVLGGRATWLAAGPQWEPLASNKVDQALGRIELAGA